MKRLTFLFLCVALFPAFAQVSPPVGSPVPDAAKELTSNTTVTSDQFKLDMQNKEGFFTGNVIMIGSSFKLKAREMTVYFNETNQVKRLLARGNVEIEQPDRTAKAGQADYTTTDAKMILTESPQVTQNRNTVTGNVITIYRDNNRMDVDGRSRVILYQEESASKATPIKGKP